MLIINLRLNRLYISRGIRQEKHALMPNKQFFVWPSSLNNCQTMIPFLFVSTHVTVYNTNPVKPVKHLALACQLLGTCSTDASLVIQILHFALFHYHSSCSFMGATETHFFLRNGSSLG